MDFQDLPVSPPGDGWGRGGGVLNEPQPSVCKIYHSKLGRTPTAGRVPLCMQAMSQACPQ